FVRTLNQPLAALDAATIRSVLEDQVAQGRELIELEKVVCTDIRVHHKADMQFQGQSHVLGVNLPRSDLTLEELRELFAKAYWRRFQVALPELRPVLVNLHTAVIGGRKLLPIESIQPAAAGTSARNGSNKNGSSRNGPGRRLV